MSFGGGSQQQQQQQSNVPEWAIPYVKSFLPVGERQLASSQSAQNVAGGPQAQATNLLSGIVAGNQLSPESNPYLAQQADVIQQGGMNALGNQLAQADRGAQGSGMLLSSAASAQRNNAAQAGSQNVANALTSMYGQNYQSGLNRQMTALPQLQAQDPYQKALQIASMMSGGNVGGSSSGSGSSSSFNIGLT